jgi:hypothetical protein
MTAQYGNVRGSRPFGSARTRRRHLGMKLPATLQCLHGKIPVAASNQPMLAYATIDANDFLSANKITAAFPAAVAKPRLSQQPCLCRSR